MILPILKKKEFNPVPIYVSIGSADIATVWRKAGTNVYFAPGRYLGIVKDGDNVVGQKYRKLSDPEKEAVVTAIKQQNRDAIIHFELGN